MKAHYHGTGEHRRPIHNTGTHILSAVAAVLAFMVVYAYADDPKLYYAIAAAAVMAGAIYFANYMQFHRRNRHRAK